MRSCICGSFVDAARGMGCANAFVENATAKYALASDAALRRSLASGTAHHTNSAAFAAGCVASRKHVAHWGEGLFPFKRGRS
jgi:hypothetical protein